MLIKKSYLDKQGFSKTKSFDLTSGRLKSTKLYVRKKIEIEVVEFEKVLVNLRNSFFKTILKIQIVIDTINFKNYVFSKQTHTS